MKSPITCLKTRKIAVWFLVLLLFLVLTGITEAKAQKVPNSEWKCPNDKSWGDCRHEVCGQKWLCTQDIAEDMDIGNDARDFGSPYERTPSDAQDHESENENQADAVVDDSLANISSPYESYETDADRENNRKYLEESIQERDTAWRDYLQERYAKKPQKPEVLRPPVDPQVIPKDAQLELPSSDYFHMAGESVGAMGFNDEISADLGSVLNAAATGIGFVEKASGYVGDATAINEYRKNPDSMESQLGLASRIFNGLSSFLPINYVSNFAEGYFKGLPKIMESSVGRGIDLIEGREVRDIEGVEEIFYPFMPAGGSWLRPSEKEE